MSRFSPPVPLFVWGSATRINLINLIEKSGKTPWFPRAPGAPGGPRGPPFSKKKFEIYFFYIFFISLISLIWRHDTPHGTRQRRVKKQHTDSFSIRFIRRDAGNGMFSGAGTSRSQLPHRSCAAKDITKLHIVKAILKGLRWISRGLRGISIDVERAPKNSKNSKVREAAPVAGREIKRQKAEARGA